ncbi:MAG: beta-1,4-mannosyl-glycoprotein beta-1,4-N-acetylglucosaminyltransferase [Flavobacteriaceae bacterium]|jgi:beta-1,4-mannosyl-glycoprotein beta-1,4-N-acetylglucosaminyltransferase|nr:beta-1,4-mannosyl-glycoprotein beta-1,4-N-acetylglucosaminyltransferase [Flavobacteriaceae bacterium]
MQKPKIYDCFCYFNEDMLLTLRLETLWDTVDYFVISEANYSHSGNDRKTLFNINNFSKYTKKIRYLRLDERPAGENDFWKNENFIRNNISKGLFDAQPNDLILISDLDEIPNPAVIHSYEPEFLRGDFSQRYYSYFFNNFWIGDVNKKDSIIPKSNIWQGSKITTFCYFTTFFNSNATSVRSYKSTGLLRALKRKWFKRFRTQTFPNGGWHFTWIFSIDDLIKKIENTAHQEFNQPKFKDPNHIKHMIKNGRDFHKPNSRYVIQSIDDSYPAHLVKNQHLYRKYILSRDKNTLL